MHHYYLAQELDSQNKHGMIRVKEQTRLRQLEQSIGKRLGKIFGGKKDLVTSWLEVVRALEKDKEGYRVTLICK